VADTTLKLSKQTSLFWQIQYNVNLALTTDVAKKHASFKKLAYFGQF
jgi:hypothetical protein